ncbi:MAG: glycosyltransferase family 4 protein [Gemmatimonadaceae bacterium]
MTRYLLYTEDYPSRSSPRSRKTGIGRYCSDLAAGLTQLGHSVAVLTGDDGSASLVGSPSEPSVDRVGREPRWPHQLVRRAWMLRRRLARERPDYLLVGDPVAHQVVAIAQLPPGFRYCPMFYGTELGGYRDLLAYGGWQPGRRLRRRTLAAYIRQAHQPVVISRYTARRLAALGLPPRRECVVFPAVSDRFLTQPVGAVGVDDRIAGRSASGVDDPVRFITVARISERKNQRQVLETLATLRRQHGLRFEYVMVGNVDSPEHGSYLESIRRFIREHRLEDSVRLIDRATDEEKVAWIDASDVFVMLSRTVGHSVEGFGISVIEASCRGKPVVVSDQGGMPETIIEGQTGFAVPLDSLEAIAAPLLKLARQPALRETLGANGSRFVRGNFTPRRMGERLAAHMHALEGAPIVASTARYASPGTHTPVRS